MEKDAKPAKFQMAIQGGMLEALGINMYTTLGKCLVEFAANAYDSNASRVEISIPFEKIEEGRAKLKAEDKAARAMLKSATPIAGVAPALTASPIDLPKKQNPDAGIGISADDAFEKPVSIAPADISLFKKALPESIAIVITDHGHGMSPKDVAEKFLPVNRHRRTDDKGTESKLRSEGNKRAVMGRKGLGKLAGFGIAEKIVIETKREGDDFRTRFELDAGVLSKAQNLSNVEIPATYEADSDLSRSGTTITLRALKPDAMRSTQEKIVDTVAEAFYGIDPADFAVLMNEVPVVAKPVEYDFVYPENSSSTGQLVDDAVHVPDIGTIPIKYAVRFRKPGQHLTAAKRGARIYCNKRLAAGPSLFKLGTGMHNFHAQDYLECVVVADALDQLGIDFVNTNRTQLREDNDIVDTVLQHVSDLMKAAMAAHSKYRDKKVETEIGESQQGMMMKKIISHLPARSRTPAGKLLKTIAARYGTDSIEFKEMAPLVVQSVNASETLIRLIELQTDAQTLGQVARELRELAEIERSDSLKLYRGRKNGIIALRNLIEKGEDLWKTKRIENELQDLFKKDPWLIKPEYSHYLTSDQNLQRLASKIAKMLEVDTFAPIVDETGKPDKDRPDLTFVMSDAASPHVFTIVELKSPSIPLDHDHLVQLQTYMAKVEMFISTELKKPATVNGYLIGAMPDAKEKLKDREMLLMSQIDKRPPSSQWEVIGLEQVLVRAQEIHSDAIKAFEVDEKDLLESEVQSDAATSSALPT